MIKIAILGAGPSGMMGCHAASQCGAHVDIFDAEPDQSRRSSGVYYLHSDCDLLLDSVTIRQGLLGAHLMSFDEIKEAYGMKVYGKPVSKTSVLDPIQNPIITGYNSGQAIDRLWDLYGQHVSKHKIEGISDVHRLLRQYDKVISTIPAYILYPYHENSENGPYECVETSIKVGKAPEHEAFIFYNVGSGNDWYRCSAMFGVFVQEFGFQTDLIEEPDNNYDFRTVRKVIGDGIKSDVDNLFLTGRYGAWNKKILTHHVYDDVLNYLGYSG